MGFIIFLLPVPSPNRLSLFSVAHYRGLNCSSLLSFLYLFLLLLPSPSFCFLLSFLFILPHENCSTLTIPCEPSIIFGRRSPKVEQKTCAEGFLRVSRKMRVRLRLGKFRARVGA